MTGAPRYTQTVQEPCQAVARNHGEFPARGCVEVTRVAMRHDPMDVSSRTTRFESTAVALEIGCFHAG
jgi:hypothetical protein